MNIEKPKTLTENPTSKEADSLSAHKTENIDQEKIPTILDSSPSEEAAEIEEKNFTVRLTDLKKAMEEMKEHGEEITEEMFENIMKIDFPTFESYVNDGKIIEQEDLKSFHQKVSDILNGEFNQSYTEKGLGGVMKKKPNKALFAALCLFLKFGGLAQTNEHKAVVKDKVIAGTEVTAQPDLEGGDPGMKKMNAKDTHKLDPKDPLLDRSDIKDSKSDHEDAKTSVENLKEVSNLDILQSFKTDSPDISKADSLEITSKVHKFLDKIGPKNYKEFKEARKVMEVYSDERATKFGAKDPNAEPKVENNVNLTRARIVKGVGIGESAFKTHDYSKSGLAADQVKEMKNTKIESETSEKGYKTIAELKKINPETGKIYTPDDVAKMKASNKASDKALYNELLKKCRSAEMHLMVESSALQKVVKASESFIWMDDSPSSKALHNAVANELIERLSKQSDDNAKITIIYYSEEIDQVVECKNVADAIEVLKVKKDDGAGHIENPFASVKYLEEVIKNDSEKIKKGGETPKDRVGVIVANEGLQDAKNLFKAITAMEKANIDVKGGRAILSMYSSKTPKPLEIKLIDLKDKIEAAVKSTLNSTISKLTEKINQSEKDQNAKIDQVIKTVDHKLLKLIFPAEKGGVGDEKTIKEKLAKGDFDFHNDYKFSQKLGDAYYTIRDVVFANEKLNTDKAGLKYAQTETTEHYLSSHNVQIKTFTDEKGNKTTFDIYDGGDQFTGPGYVPPKAELLNL